MKYDVIISGAGPVGLFLACEIALAECSVLVLEKAVNPQSPLKKFPFGIRGLNALSIEAFYRRGMLEDFELHKRFKNPHMSKSKNQGGGHFAGIQFQEDKIDTSQWKYRLPGSTPTILLSEMEEVESVLIRRAETLGVEIRRGTAITGFQQDEDEVAVFSQEQTFKGKWLVGCDGARSVIRKAGNFEFAGTEPEFTGYSAKIDMTNADSLKMGRNVTDTGMYLRSQPDYVILQDFDGGAFHSSQQPVTIEHLQEVLTRITATDVKITTMHATTTWSDRARQATSYRNGRVFLAGDAAHIHSPLGGQGLNLGLGDAMNLGWKLAAVVKGTASDKLLDSYYAERYPIGMQVLDWSRAQVSIMKPDPSSKALHAIIKDLMDTRDGATYIAGRAWGMYTRYETGDHPLTGCSVPNFEFEDGSKIGELMHDGKGILLDFDNNTSLAAIAADHQIKYVSRNVKDKLGVKAVLIRPDGIVAWAGDELKNLKGIWA